MFVGNHTIIVNTQVGKSAILDDLVFRSPRPGVHDCNFPGFQFSKDQVVNGDIGKIESIFIGIEVDDVRASWIDRKDLSSQVAKP